MADQVLRPGDRLSEYILVERIGSGGFGEVWVARHAEIAGRTVAVKIPSDKAFVRELRSEAFLQSALVHPNIVRTLGLNTQHDPPYFVMEFVEGISLRDLIRRKKRIGPTHAARIASQMLEALDFAHARGVVHRDVKPGNVICGSDGKVRVTDFGLSQVADASISTMKHSGGRGPAPRLVPGTALYMPPEQRRGQAVDGRADVYASGVVLYEMLTGELPTGCDLPSEVNPRVPAELDMIVKRAMKADPAKRYATAGAMKSDLDAFLRGEAPNARREGWSARAQQRWMVATAVATVAIAAVGLLAPVFGKGRTRTEAYRAGPAAAEQPVAPGDAAKAGRVLLRTVPGGADVYIDGRNYGPSPAPIEGLTAGTHVVTFRLKDFAELTSEITVGPGEELAPTFRLENLIGGLSIETAPEGASVLVDGRDFGKALPRLDLRNLPAGRHMVRVEMPGFHSYEADVEVAGGRVTQRRFELKPYGYGSLLIESVPRGARVFVAGKESGVTPITVERLLEGRYKVELFLDGHEPFEITLDVAADEVTHHAHDLVAIPASLDLRVPKGVPVWVDGKRVSAAEPLALTAGEHRVRVFDVEKVVALKPGKKGESGFTFEELGMVRVDAGDFLMGDVNGFPDAKPARRVRLSAYAIDRCEVTVAQYRAFLEEIVRTGDHSKCHPEEPKGKDHTPAKWSDSVRSADRMPVLGVDWFDAYAYAAWAGKRLPTEAEWERAARGDDGRTYPWGSAEPWSGDKPYACLGGRTGTQTPSPVGSYPQGASPFGCQDMLGNAWEWCADWYSPDAYAGASELNPRGPDGGRARVVRGGSFGSHPYDVRAFDRASGDALPDPKATAGFRCAADLEE